MANTYLLSNDTTDPDDSLVCAGTGTSPWSCDDDLTGGGGGLGGGLNEG